MNYLLNVTQTYRVPTVAAALKLRDTLSNLSYGELASFSYTHKDIKSKGEIVDSYELVKAKISFTGEKEPEVVVHCEYHAGEDE